MLDFTPANNSQWIPVGINLPHVPISGLEINYVANKLRVSTLGRGMWELHLVCPSQNLLTFSYVTIAPMFHEANTITVDNAFTSSIDVTVLRATNTITLNPDFFTEALSANAQFKAFIHPCDGDGNSPLIKNTDGLNFEGIQVREDEKPLVNRNSISSFGAYPNPTSGVFTLLIGNETEESNSVYVYNSLGEIAYSKLNISSSVTELPIDLQSQKNGVYLIRVVKTNGEAKTIKVIKQ